MRRSATTPHLQTITSLNHQIHPRTPPRLQRARGAQQTDQSFSCKAAARSERACQKQVAAWSCQNSSKLFSCLRAFKPRKHTNETEWLHNRWQTVR